jgi:hypothetical protein
MSTSQLVHSIGPWPDPPEPGPPSESETGSFATKRVFDSSSERSESAAAVIGLTQRRQAQLIGARRCSSAKPPSCLWSESTRIPGTWKPGPAGSVSTISCYGEDRPRESLQRLERIQHAAGKLVHGAGCEEGDIGQGVEYVLRRGRGWRWV